MVGVDRKAKIGMVKHAMGIVKVDNQIMNEIEKSPLFQDYWYLSEACILLKMNEITLDEFLALRYVSRDQLDIYLTNNGFDYLKVPTEEELKDAFEVLDMPVSRNVEKTSEDLEFEMKIQKLQELARLVKDTNSGKKR